MLAEQIEIAQSYILVVPAPAPTPTEITLDCKDCTREANGVDRGDKVCPEGYDFYSAYVLFLGMFTYICLVKTPLLPNWREFHPGGACPHRDRSRSGGQVSHGHGKRSLLTRASLRLIRKYSRAN